MKYDNKILENGNIKTLQRYGEINLLHDVTCSHNGNRLTHINSTLAYNYNANGNMTYDGRKNINIEYNLLNLPHVISESGTVKATYKYIADGTKWSTKYIATNNYTIAIDKYRNNEIQTTRTLN